MKQFMAFVKKEFHHIFRDRRTMLILLGMPIVQIILFGFAIRTEVKNVRMAVLDPSNDVVTQKIIERLKASEYFNITENIHSPQEMETAFLTGCIDMAVVFGPNFAEGLYTGDARLQFVTDATDPNMSTAQTNYAAGVVAAVQQEMLSPDLTMSRLTPNIKLLYNPQMKSAYNFVPGVMGLILMLICAMMTSISIVREKRNGYYGSFIDFPHPSVVYYHSESRTLFYVVVYQSADDIVAFCVCVGSAGSRQFIGARHDILALYFRLFVTGIAHFIGYTYSSGGNARFRTGIDDAHYGFVRNDFSNRKHALGAPGHCEHTSCTLVYRSHTEVDDSRGIGDGNI